MRAMLRCPAGKALIVTGMRSATQRVSSAVSSPWSWAARRPMPLTMSTTRVGASLRKTPTVRISGGTRSMMRRTAWGATWRGEGANTNPMASAPSPTARSASASEVMPQIFTSTGSPLCRRPRAHLGEPGAGARAHPVPGEGPDGGDAVGGPDERFPHQHGLVADGGEASDVVFAPDARLGHRHHLGGDVLHETGGSIGVDREGREVALVHPDELRPGVEGPRQLDLVVHLDHGVERELPGHAQEA